MHPIDSYLVHSIRAGPLFSDQFSLLFQITVKKHKRPTISRSTRHLNYISISQFLTDLNMFPTHDAQSLHNSLPYTLDIHAPVINKTIILLHDTSCYVTQCTLSIFHVKNNVYACLNLNGKKKYLH